MASTPCIPGSLATRQAPSEDVPSNLVVEKTAHYSYISLKSERCIRLLELWPFSSDACARPWSVTLTSFPLDDCPSFKALSYTWGPAIQSDAAFKKEGVPDALIKGRYAHEGYQITVDAPEFVDIQCGLDRLRVTKNLFDFLDALYHDSTSTSLPPGYLWIDAICIDQQNLNERNAQVALMGDVYASASETIIWLGNNTTDLDNVLTLCALDIAARAAKEGPRYPQYISALKEKTESYWKELWSGFFRFFERRRYFYRAWVFQENALSRDLTVRCGQTNFPFFKIQWLWHFIRLHGSSIAVAYFQDGGFFSSFPSLLSMAQLDLDLDVCRKLQYPQDALDSTLEHTWFGYLSYVLSEIRWSSCVDDRDKVFSIFGLANKLSPRFRLVADYSSPPHEVYLSIAKDMITSRPGLVTLYHREDDPHPRSRRDWLLPTWVPDFGSLSKSHYISTLQLFNVTGNPPFSLDTPTVDGLLLRISGAPFDTVSNVGKSSCQAAASFVEMLHSMPQPYTPTNQSSLEALWRTTIRDSAWTGSAMQHPAPGDLASSFRAWFTAKCSTLNPLYFAALVALSSRDTTDILPSAAETLRYKNESDAEIDKKAQAYTAAITSAHAWDRKHFLTSNGSLGIGPQYMQDGDEVFLLMGARTPFVLRKMPDSANYIFIGPCYVHGLMQGMMLDVVKDRLGTVTIE